LIGGRDSGGVQGWRGGHFSHSLCEKQNQSNGFRLWYKAARRTHRRILKKSGRALEIISKLPNLECQLNRSEHDAARKSDTNRARIRQ
jgi:hypothetical protein